MQKERVVSIKHGSFFIQKCSWCWGRHGGLGEKKVYWCGAHQSLHRWLLKGCVSSDRAASIYLSLHHVEFTNSIHSVYDTPMPFTLSPWKPGQWWIYSLFPPSLSFPLWRLGVGVQGVVYSQRPAPKSCLPLIPGACQWGNWWCFHYKMWEQGGASCLNGQPQP